MCQTQRLTCHLLSTASGYYGEQQMQHQLQSHAPIDYGHPASNGTRGYYAPTQQHHGSAYGNVYYSANQGGNHDNIDLRNQSLNALNNFYSDTQSGVFDPKSYPQVESRLLTIQAGQLSFMGNGGMAEYQGGNSLGGAGTQVGFYGPTPQYQLPALDNLRTKNDLLVVDRIMEQAQATIYDHPNLMAAAGVTQPGAIHVSSGHQYRQSQSPPRAQVASSHRSTVAATSPATVAASQLTTDSPPALTPTDSTHSYPSARSPVSLASNGAMSPTTSAAMYPTLPSTSSAAMSHNYFQSGMAPTSALGAQFNEDYHRRMPGSNLHKAQPLRTLTRDSALKHAKKINEDDMDTSSDDGIEVKAGGPVTPQSEEDEATPQPHSRSEVSPSMIDPALSGEAVTSQSPGELDENDIKADEVWVSIVRTIEDLRAWILHRLKHGEYESSKEEQEADEQRRVRRNRMERERRHKKRQVDESSEADEPMEGAGQVDGEGANASHDTEVHYPTLSGRDES